MMIVARSYHYQAPPPPKRSNKSAKRIESDAKEPVEDERVRGFGWRPPSFSKTIDDARLDNPPLSSHSDAAEDTFPPSGFRLTEVDQDIRERPCDESANENYSSNLSKPMAVPLRKRGSTRSVATTSLDRGQNSMAGHDPQALPSSIAALMAVTAIPKRQFPRKPRPLARRISSNELMDEWKSWGEREQSPNGSSPTMHLLLSPPDEVSPLQRSLSQESVYNFDTHSRSGSSDSMPSLTNSFDLDDEQSLSPSSLPEIPAIQTRRRRSEKRERISMSPRSVEYDVDHPLKWPVLPEEAQEEEPFPPPASTTRLKRTPRSAPKPSTLRSNLTASLNTLRTAARSFSNFAAPSIPPEDYLARSIFGPPHYGSEMRPKPLIGTPAPEFRRYLNPTQQHHHLIPTDFHLHASHIDHTDLEAVALRHPHPHAAAVAIAPPGAVIPLETYTLAPPSQNKTASAAPNTATEAGRAAVPGVHRREPRENAEFLRVCVLEMNMRRAGKLEHDAPGQARFWLPPRDGVCVEEVGGAERHRGERVGGKPKVPRRWMGVSAGEGEG